MLLRMALIVCFSALTATAQDVQKLSYKVGSIEGFFQLSMNGKTLKVEHFSVGKGLAEGRVEKTPAPASFEFIVLTDKSQYLIYGNDLAMRPEIKVDIPEMTNKVEIKVGPWEPNLESFGSKNSVSFENLNIGNPSKANLRPPPNVVARKINLGGQEMRLYFKLLRHNSYTDVAPNVGKELVFTYEPISKKLNGVEGRFRFKLNGNKLTVVHEKRNLLSRKFEASVAPFTPKFFVTTADGYFQINEKALLTNAKTKVVDPALKGAVNITMDLKSQYGPFYFDKNSGFLQNKEGVSATELSRVMKQLQRTFRSDDFQRDMLGKRSKTKPKADPIAEIPYQYVYGKNKRMDGKIKFKMLPGNVIEISNLRTNRFGFHAVNTWTAAQFQFLPIIKILVDGKLIKVDPKAFDGRSGLKIEVPSSEVAIFLSDRSTQGLAYEKSSVQLSLKKKPAINLKKILKNAKATGTPLCP